jgi:3-hydroxyisobutyrate dehydrogenase-like beta-hydroxyacid dehydrogenase
MGPPQTLEATGTMLASGPRAIFDRISPSLETMTGSVRYLGEGVDRAAVYKLLGNAMILAVIGGLNDVFRIAEERGLTREEAYELFSFYNVGGQISGRGQRMSQNEFDATWTIDMARKDAQLMQGAANHAPLPVIDAVEVLMDACIKHGFGALDLGAIAKR